MQLSFIIINALDERGDGANVLPPAVRAVITRGRLFLAFGKLSIAAFA